MSAESSSGNAPVAGVDGGELERLYTAHAASCYGLATRVTGDTEVAADVVRQVFTDVSANPDAYASPTATCPVALLTLTHEKACAAARGQRRPAERLLAPTDDRRKPPALGRMPAADVEMVTLAYFRACTQAEIATATGLPLSEVRARTLRALRSLRGDQAEVASVTPAADESRVRPARVARPRRP